MEGGGPDEGVVQGQVPVALSRPSACPVTVRYQTSDRPPLPWAATPGTDDVPTAGTLTFASGETTQLIGVEVVGDAVPEPGEMVLVGLSEPSGATIGGSGGIGGLLIGDDD
jgi:hypothetical protein